MATRILENLARVDHQRRVRVEERLLNVLVDRLKWYQHQRFRRTYSDLLQDPRYAGAARFFLRELYGPYDFSTRDAEFARVVPTLVRIFPDEVVETVGALALLHAISEELDTSMARHLHAENIDRGSYIEAWRRTGRRDDRVQQIVLMLRIGRDLERYTRIGWLRHSLRVMRMPARAAGLENLQQFLEVGYETFRSMADPSHFLQCIAVRERRLMDDLFAVSGGLPTDCGVLQQLPPNSADVR